MRFELLSGNADQVRERLENGLLDIGLLVDSMDIEKYEQIPLPQQDRWGVPMRADDPMAEKVYLTAEDLQGLPLIMSCRATVQGRISRELGLGDSVQDLDIFCAYDLIANAAMLVHYGLGNAVCIDGAVCIYEEGPFHFAPQCPEVTMSAVLVWHKWQRFGEASARFLDSAQMLLGRIL